MNARCRLLLVHPDRRARAAWLALLAAALLAATPELSRGQGSPSVTRGPYLQMGTATGVVVRWRTNAATDSRVRYGLAPDALGQQVDDAASATDHVVALGGLLPETRYFYSVGSSQQTLAGDATYTFVTAPPPGTPRPVRIWTFGDGGMANVSQASVRDAYLAFTGARGTDLWLLLGDNAYDNATDADYQNTFFTRFQASLRQTVLWSTFGNHEGRTSNSLAQVGAYYDIFTFPTAGEAGGEPSGTEAYYSFDHANIHFIILNSYDVPRLEGGEMVAWLRRDLARNRQDWTIVAFHHPPYSKGSHDSDGPTPLDPLADTPDSAVPIKEMREIIVPILEEAGVDLVLTGHSHSYERSFFIDGHYGLSGTFGAAHKKDGGDGEVLGDGPYRKTDDIDADAHTGTLYAVVGSASSVTGGSLDHPAMVTSLNELGSMVIDVSGKRLDATFLQPGIAGGPPVVRERITIAKGDGNLDPAAVDDAGRTRPETAVGIPVLVNDVDPDGDAIAVASVADPPNGSAAFAAETVTYTPDAGFVGVDSFIYTIEDGRGGSASATVKVTVQQPPVAVDDTASTERDRAVSIPVLANDSHPGGDALTVTSVTAPSRGTATTDGTRVTYTPAAGFAGHDALRYTVSDSVGATATASVSVTVTCPPLPGGAFFDDVEPAAEPGWSVDTAIDGGNVRQPWAVRPDPGAQSPTQSWSSNDANDVKDDRLVSPPLDLTATSRLRFWHRFAFESDLDNYDGGVLEISADGGVTWADLGGAFVSGGYNGTLFASGDNPLRGRAAWVGPSDGAGALMTLVEVDLGAFAGPGRRIRWRLGCDSTNLAPAVGWFVDDVEVTDVAGAPGNCNEPPLAVDDHALTDAETPVTIPVLANDGDPNNDSLTVTEVSAPAHGTAEASEGGSAVTYTPAAGFSGQDAFDYTVSDGNGGTDVGGVTVEVRALPCASLIFTDGFESGDLSAWSASETDGGALAAAADAALRGAFGLRAILDGAGDLFVRDESPALEPVYCAGFLLDPRDVSAQGRGLILLEALAESDAAVLRATLRGAEGVYELRIHARQDSTSGHTWVKTDSLPLGPAAAAITIVWTRSSATGADDGRVEVYVDGVARATLSGLDTDGLGGVEAVRLGALGELKHGAGTLALDEFVSGRALAAP